MVLIKATPLQRPFDFNYDNQFFINPEQIKVAVYNDKEWNGMDKMVNVILFDGSEWQIKRELFNEMIITTDVKGK